MGSFLAIDDPWFRHLESMDASKELGSKLDTIAFTLKEARAAKDAATAIWGRPPQVAAPGPATDLTPVVSAVQLGVKQLEDAIAATAKLADWRLGRLEHALLGQSHTLTQILDATLQSDSQKQERHLLSRAAQRYRDGFHLEALEDYDAALKLDSANWYAHAGRATILLYSPEVPGAESDRLAAAEESFKRAARYARPRDAARAASLLHQAAIAASIRGAAAPACEYAKDALALDSTRLEYLYAYARVLVAAGRHGEGLYRARQLIALDPTFHGVLVDDPTFAPVSTGLERAFDDRRKALASRVREQMKRVLTTCADLDWLHADERQKLEMSAQKVIDLVEQDLPSCLRGCAEAPDVLRTMARAQCPIFVMASNVVVPDNAADREMWTANKKDLHQIPNGHVKREQLLRALAVRFREKNSWGYPSVWELSDPSGTCAYLVRPVHVRDEGKTYNSVTMLYRDSTGPFFLMAESPLALYESGLVLLSGPFPEDGNTVWWAEAMPAPARAAWRKRVADWAAMAARERADKEEATRTREAEQARQQTEQARQQAERTQREAEDRAADLAARRAVWATVLKGGLVAVFVLVVGVVAAVKAWAPEAPLSDVSQFNTTGYPSWADTPPLHYYEEVGLVKLPQTGHSASPDEEPGVFDMGPGELEPGAMWVGACEDTETATLFFDVWQPPSTRALRVTIGPQDLDPGRNLVQIVAPDAPIDASKAAKILYWASARRENLKVHPIVLSRTNEVSAFCKCSKGSAGRRAVESQCDR